MEFTGFLFKTGTDEYEGKFRQVQEDFSVNDLITICDVLWKDNAGFRYVLIARIIYNLRHLSVLKSNIIPDNNDNGDIETKNIETKNISSSKINDANSENNLRNYFGNTKNKMAASDP